MINNAIVTPERGVIDIKKEEIDDNFIVIKEEDKSPITMRSLNELEFKELVYNLERTIHINKGIYERTINFRDCKSNDSNTRTEDFIISKNNLALIFKVAIYQTASNFKKCLRPCECLKVLGIYSIVGNELIWKLNDNLTIKLSNINLNKFSDDFKKVKRPTVAIRKKIHKMKKKTTNARHKLVNTNRFEYELMILDKCNETCRITIYKDNETVLYLNKIMINDWEKTFSAPINFNIINNLRFR